MLLSLLCLTGAAPADGGGENRERAGKLAIEVAWNASRDEVVIRGRCTYTLAPDSEALAALREEGTAFCGGYSLSLSELTDARLGNPTTRVRQESPRSPARVETGIATYESIVPGSVTLFIDIDMARALEHGPAGLPGDWTVEVKAPRWSFTGIRGPVESQSPDTVTWKVTSASQVEPAVTRSVRLSRELETTEPFTLRWWPLRLERITAFGVAACGIGVVAALLVARLVGPAVRGRWWTAAMVPAVIACLLAFGVPEPVLFHPATIPSDDTPDIAFVGDWEPSAVLGLWLWYVLPVAGWWFSHRLATGGPPSGRMLAASGATPLLLLPAMMANGATPNLTGWILPAVTGALAITVALVLRHGGGRVGRRWAATAGTLLWLTGLVHWAGHSPVLDDGDVTWTVHETAAVLACTWPPVVWLTSLLGPVLGHTVRPLDRALSGIFLWTLLTGPFLASAVAERIFGDQGLPASPFTGYVGLPLCVMAFCGVALQLVYLLRRGGLRDRGRAIEPVGRVLLVCAVLMALGYPSLRTLIIWGVALAVLWAALGSWLLIPVGSGVTAAKFRRVERRAHAPFMNRWVRTQLLWDTRADFQRAARSTLAEDMPVTDFDDRWRKLDVPGRCGDPATRLARAKRFALGTSAGAPPGKEGLRGALLMQLLALPWATYQLLFTEAVGHDGSTPFALGQISKLLRFAHWALYGFVFGYFYALLRGSTPIAKAAMLMAVVLPAELLVVIPLTADVAYTVNPSWNDTAVTCGVLAGQILVPCMVLGLVWEWRLAQAAALKWSQVRNFRRLSSVTVPLGTVLVAAATAFATVVAGAWAQQELQPPPGAPSPTQSAPAQPGLAPAP
ncbi:hypothetical protein GCM10010297_00150 [Streptomyces malachitofuscus]|nr:hypothetical protein GCM10010297_00150 [Streptomyces malachitofuscus]